MVVALVALVTLGVSGGGCAAGEGKGSVTGTLNVSECRFSPTRGFPEDPNDVYNLNPDFFVGEPFDSSTPRFPANQLAIRMQSSGVRLEFADALLFWVSDSYEVARCVRGANNADGSPDWNPALCDRSPAALGPSNEGRLFIGQEGETVSSHLVLNFTCPDAFVTADALGDCAGGTCPALDLCPGRGSWIRFSRFGSATGSVTPGFKVNNGETVEASLFHVELCDGGTVSAARDRVVPVPVPVIVGTLEGDFSFNLQPQFQ